MYVVMLKWMGRWDWWTVEVKVNGECWWLNGESNVMNHNWGMPSKVQLWAGKADTFGFGVTFSNPSFCRKRNLFLTWGKFGLKSLALSKWVLFTRKDAFSEKAQIFHCPLFTNHLFSESSLVRRSFLGLSVINFTTTDPHQFYNVKRYVYPKLLLFAPFKTFTLRMFLANEENLILRESTKNHTLTYSYSYLMISD